MGKRAFTLAEVLIVLGIIGIVAAMTIPTLMNKTRNIALESALKKEYSSIANATQLVVQNEYGGSVSELADNGVEPLFLAFRKYLSYVKCKSIYDCSSAYPLRTCVSYKGFIESNYKTYTNNVPTGDCISDRVFILNDGAFVVLDNCTPPNPYRITVDVNGWAKKPNKFGYDMFQFQIVNGRLLPMGAKNTDMETITESDYCSTSSSDGWNGLGCTSKALNDRDYFNKL